MNRQKIFEQRQSEMTDKELYELLDEELSKLCKTYGKSFTMSIPAMITDTDMLIGEMLERFEKMSECTKHLLSDVASIEQIEEVARKYFEVKYPLMDLTNDDDKCEIDWWDMLKFVQHVLSCHCR